MPRPDDVTQEMVDGWDAEMDANPPDGIPEFMLKMPQVREVGYAGNWLGDKLKDAGADEDTVERMTFAAGQKMVFSPDPWEVAVAELARYSSDGTYDQPGPELAVKLVREHIGPLDDKE